ncbi:ACT domain protein, partial [Terribacillus saccharophilus]
METLEWYLEYEIQHNRPGLLGDISSLLGMLSINIKTI